MSDPTHTNQLCKVIETLGMLLQQVRENNDRALNDGILGSLDTAVAALMNSVDLVPGGSGPLEPK